MDYILTTQITESYYQVSQNLFKSIKKYWKYKFIVGFIDFVPNDYNDPYYLMERSKIDTYRTDYPSNRTDFVCPQGGEFINYINCKNDDIIIQIDSDTILQREITESELKLITPKDDEFISVYHSNPPLSLSLVANNLSFKNLNNYNKMNHLFEFTPSFIVANKLSFLKLKFEIINLWNDFIKINNHHAGIQWLISYIIYNKFKIKIVDNIFQCANWYLKFDTEIKNGKLCLNNNIVLFNHTKFNDSDLII